jgi:hypothetical protein
MKLSDTELTMAERQLIENSLLRGEELLWVGKPVPRMWSPLTIIMMVMGVFFLCIDSVVTLGVMEMGGIELLFSLPFMIAGALMIASPWIGVSWQKHHVYALTTRRSLVFRYMFWKHHQMSFPVDKVMLIDRKVPAAGLVSLVLGKSSISSTNNVPDPEGFLNITEDAAAVVEPIIMQLEESYTK